MGARTVSGAPPLPPGFVVETPRRRPQRGMFGNATPAPAPVDPPQSAPVNAPRAVPGQLLRTAPVDGDTFRLNSRLYGVDAFERSQTMRLPDGSTVPIGQQALSYLQSRVNPDTRVNFIGEQTYGRPVATLSNPVGDVGLDMVRQGLAVVEPQYLRNDPARLRLYQAAEAEARAAGRGGWAGEFQRPSDYRHSGGRSVGEQVAPVASPPVPPGDAGWQYNGAVMTAMQAALRAGLISPETYDSFYPATTSEQTISAAPARGWLDRVATGFERAQSLAGTGEFGAFSRGLSDLANLNDSYQAAMVGGTDAQREAWRDALARGDVLATRQQWQMQDAADPSWRQDGTMLGNLWRSSGELLGDTAGNANPTYLIGGPAGRGIKMVGQRMLIQGGVNAATDAALQGNEMREGIRTQFDPYQTGAQFVAGAGLQGAGELAGAGARLLRERYRARFGGEAGTPDGIAPNVAEPVAARPDVPVNPRPVPPGVVVEGVDEFGGRYGYYEDTGRPWGELVGTNAPDAPVAPPAAPPAPAPRQPDRIDLSAAPAAGPVVDPLRYDLPQSVGPAAAPVLPRGANPFVDRLDMAGGGARPVSGDYPPLPDGFQLVDDGGAGVPGANIAPLHQQRMAAIERLANDPAAPYADMAAAIDYLDNAYAQGLDVGPLQDRLIERVRGVEAGRTVFNDNMPETDLQRAERVAIDLEDRAYNLGFRDDRRFADQSSNEFQQWLAESNQADAAARAALDEYDRLAGRTGANPATPPPPPGFQLEGPTLGRGGELPTGPRVMPMAREGSEPTLLGPAIGAPAAPVRGAPVDLGQGTPMGQGPTRAQLDAMAQRMQPADVLPRPSNVVRNVDEAASINAGLYEPVRATNERAELSARSFPAPNGTGQTVVHRGPLDLVTFLRTKGGMRDQGGELAYIGLDNRSRSMDFAGGEHRLGKLVSDGGMTLDDAALTAWEAGYFPQHADRPSVDEFLDALRDTYDGTNRRFLPSDYEEVARFENTQSQRYAVEAARLDGAPLVREIGEPATLADIEANTPPLSAFDDLPGGAPDFAGNIRLGNLDTPQDIAQALAVTSSRLDGFDTARRGRIAQQETERLAAELGMTPDSLLQRRAGQAFNAEQALAARQILAKSANELVNLARRVQQVENPGDELLADFQRAWLRHVAIQEQIAGMTAEAGRTLAQFRMMADSRVIRREVLASAVTSGGGVDRLKGVADVILEAEDVSQLNRLARDAVKPRFRDKLVELWYNMLLSGPQTHVVNVMSNTMTALGQLPEHAVAAAIGAPRALMSRAQADRVLFSELGARSVGLIAGTREGLRQFARTVRTGEPADAASKVEAQVQRAISGVKGEIIRVPTRLLSAEDELFKAMARRMELHGLAIRQANKEGLRGAAAKARAAELVADPTDDMLAQAFDYGRYLTFQRQLGPVGQSVSRITQDMPILKVVLPFVRTPTNILKFAIERSPAAPLLREWRKDFGAGGARRDLAVAKVLVGSGLGATMAMAAQSGLITGGPPTDRQREAVLRANGWQPYSIYWGGRYYSYQRLDPFALTIGTAADMATRMDGMSEKQQDNAATLLVASFMSQLGDKTWLSGVSDLVQAIQDPQRYMDSFLNRLAGSVVPTGVAQVTRTLDPTARARDGMGDAILARVPGASISLYPQRDILGRPIVSEGGLGPDIVSPIWTSTNRNDPVLNALAAARIGFDRPDRTVAGRKLTMAEYDRYQADTGRIAYPLLRSLVEAPTWPRLSRDDQQEAVRDVMRDARKEARRGMFGGASPAAPRRPANTNALAPPPGFTPVRPQQNALAPRGGMVAAPRLPRSTPPPSSLPPLPPGFEVVQ